MNELLCLRKKKKEPIHSPSRLHERAVDRIYFHYAKIYQGFFIIYLFTWILYQFIGRELKANFV